MVVKTWLPVTEEDFALAAREFEASLTLEDIMESTRQATQRQIVVDSLADLGERIPPVEWFSELLLQGVHEDRLIQVVPDNMFIVTPHPRRDRGSFNLQHEPVGPFMTIEYVSERSARKDYEVNMQKYWDLKIPYYLIFDPATRDLEVYHWSDDGYVRLEPDTNGRISVPELELQIGLLNGWVRMWHRGELLLTNLEKGRVIADKDAKLAERDAKIADQAARLTERDAQMANFLRSQIELRARKLGRDDVLEQLKTNLDLSELQRLLADLD